MKIVQILMGGVLFMSTFSVNAVYAVGDGGSASSTTNQANTDYRAGVKAVKKQDWRTAIQSLEKAVASNPNNADAWNYLGYSYRKIGNLDKSFAAYERALAIDPKHKGALEYLGEAYLQSGNLPKAQAQLDQLIQICGQNCEQTQDLKEAIAAYKAKKTLPSSSKSR